MIATTRTRSLLGLVAGWLLIGASALAAGPVVGGPADGKPDGRPAPATQLGFSNTNPAVLAHLAAEGIVGGEQVNLAGRPLGALVVDGPLGAAYPIAGGEQRATLVLDYGKDFYRFAGASECAGLVEVSWPEPVLEAQIRAGLREQGRDAYLTQAVSTIGQPTSREHLAVRGGGRFRIEATWSQGLDDSGNAATFTRTVDAAVACDQILKVSMGAAGDKRPLIGSADLYLGSPAELPRRTEGRSLLDSELAIEQTFDNGESSLCNTDEFGGGSLGGAWTFTNVGDSDQGGATVVGGRLQLTSDGTTYYHDSDNGGFVHQTVNGDFRAQVKITGFPVDAGGGYRKAGLTVRTGTGPNDARVYASFLPMHPFYNQTAIMFDVRDALGNEYELSSTPLNLTLPAWVSIERKGDKFTVYYSQNGTKWTKALGAAGGTATIPMPGAVQVGLMGASYDASVTMTSEFDDFKVCRPNVIPLPPLPPPGACAPGTPIDIVYLLDSTGSMTVPFSSGGITKLDAARNAMVDLNDLIEANLPGSRGALVTFRGGFTPAFNQTSAVNILSNLTTDFDAVDAAAASIDVNAIDPDDTTPISIALDRTLTMLQNQGSYQSLPVVIFIGDGWPNIDWEGHGPLEYLVSEMGAISIIDSGNFIPWGAAAWLGNWNGGINTYDGKPLADAMYQTLRMKSTIPEMLMFTVGVHSDGIFRPDLLSFMAAYTGGSFYEVEDANELVEVLEGIYNGLGCAPDVGADIGDTVWNDVNGDGVQNGGEQGLPGVTVELVDGNGDVVATDVTDGSGNYLFEDVDPGTYTVRVVPSTLPGGSDVQTYDFDGVGTPHAAVVTVEDEDVFLDADFGYRASAGTIGDRVWNDANGDGNQDGGEGGLPGVTVELVDGGGNVIATDVTDGNGNYLFENVAASTYTVRAVPSTLPANHDPTYDRDGVGTPHVAANVTVIDGQSVLDVDFGYRAGVATIGDRVWNDADGDGVQDGGEAGLSGVTVELVDGGGNVIATEVTDGNGNYLFEDVVPGTYTVRVVSSTLPGGSDVQTFDYDGVGTPHAAVVTVAAYDNFLLADFGYRSSAGTIGDRVWNDVDGDGVQDGGEGGLSGVTVELVDGGGNVIATEVTDGNGNYLFEDVPAGTYTVRVVPSSVPAGHDPTYDRDGVGTPHVTASVVVADGQTVLDVDFGYRAVATIGDRVWKDLDGDGVQDGGEPGLSGVTVELVDGGGNVVMSDVTDGSGNYLFEDVPAGTYTVRVVASSVPAGYTPTYDRDGIATPHVAVVTVNGGQTVLDVDYGYRQCAGKIGDRVWDDKNGNGVQDSGETGYSGVTVQLLDGGGNVIATQVTNSSGNYYFMNVAAGTYTVKVVASTLPASATQTFDKDGLATPHSAVVTLSCGQHLLDVDFGYRECEGKIGDRVWDDKDGDGNQDSGEVGFSGVTVELVNGSGTVIQTKVTNSSGNYYFTNVAPGTYTVRVVSSTLPAGATATYDKDGIVTLHTAVVTISCGQQVTNIDFGYRVCSASIGDRVWDDKNGNGAQDSGETGISGVTVELVNGSGTVIQTKVTNSSGYYNFTNVQPGTYSVRIVASTLPAGATATYDKDGIGTLHKASVTVTCSQTVTNIDFGYKFCLGTIGDKVWDDKDGDGAIDSGETGIGGVTVQLYNNSGTLLATKVTTSSGYYSFDGLPSGTYTVKVVAASLPSGMNPTWDKDGTATPHQATITLSCNQSYTNVDFGYRTCEGSVGDLVWDDKDKDGRKDSGEVGISGLTIQLLNSGGTVIATDVTDSNGKYLFENLQPGTYSVKVLTAGLPAGAHPTYDKDGTGTANIATFTLSCNQSKSDIDFGYWVPPPSIIAGCVWEDKNKDGKRAGGEVGFSGVTVQLLSGTTVVATTTTNGSGDYSFQNLTAGTYTVKVVSSTLPAEAIATHDYDGLGTLHKATVTVDMGEEIWDVCFGYMFEEDDDKWCPRTPGFWKTHPEEWPVSSLRFGNVTYNTSQLMTFLNYGGSDAATRLAHHLTATMLNLAKGSDPYIQSTVNSASSFLVNYPPGSNPQGSAKNQANSLKDKLDKYNNDEKDCKKKDKSALDFSF